MKSLRTILITVFLAAIFLFIIFGRGVVGNTIRGIREGIVGAIDSTFSYAAFRALQVENAGLRAEIEAGKQKESASHIYNELPALVYSEYPFNDKNELVVQRGSVDGVRVGMPVLAAHGVLLGVVKAVRRTQSEIQTIFDPAWKSSVVIGASRVKALLQGGDEPRLEFIPEKSIFTADARVSNSSKEFPLNLFVGTIGETTKDINTLWLTAPLIIPYTVQDITAVSIVTNFP